MSILLSTASFTGYKLLNLNATNTAVLQDYIDKYEKAYLCRILGVELAELFIADLANVSQDVRFAAIQDEFILQDTDNKIYQSRGLVFILACCILYEFMNTHVRHSDNGVVISINEAQTVVTPAQAVRYGEKKYNEIIGDVEAIQWYCDVYAENEYADEPDRLYPEYKGVELKPKWGAML